VLVVPEWIRNPELLFEETHLVEKEKYFEKERRKG
jgi:hypothetical protein